MKIIYKLPIIFLFVIIYNSGLGQNKVYEITGKIINEKDNSPVHYATVINVKKGKATTCDSLGFFHITMLSSDILRINALGFERQYFSFKDSALNASKIYIIKLKEKTYRIANVDIYEARWKDFEFEFIHTVPENEETKENIEKWFHSLIDPKELALITASVSIGIPINFKTKADKQKLKVEELKKQDAENKIIESKYNPELVTEITGLNSTETIRFMRFCNFTREFLLYSNDYDIIIEIKKQYDRYLRIKRR